MTPISEFLPFTPTSDQLTALENIEHFLDDDRQFLVLKGSAGTGKTSLVKAVSQSLREKDVVFYMAAPTARAANVMQRKTGTEAKTIHSMIYQPEPLKNKPGVQLNLADNSYNMPAIYIVDEASMISNTLTNSGQFVASAPLLEDLVKYVLMGHPANKILFIGDPYQLPPVGKDKRSPAMEAQYLGQQFGLKGSTVSLDTVMRQAEDSPILSLATALKDYMKQGKIYGDIRTKKAANTDLAIKTYLKHFSFEQPGKITMIGWRNKEIEWWNRTIRQAIGLGKDWLVKNDLLSTQQNWYHENEGWIAKGTTVRVLELDKKVEHFADLKFMQAQLLVEESRKVEAKVMIDSLGTRYGNLEPKKETALYHRVMKTNKTFRNSNNIKDDPYLSAMRLQYAYGNTCHKAQGGEWDYVILHPVYNKELRWLYTAVTRARKDICTWG